MPLLDSVIIVLHFKTTKISGSDFIKVNPVFADDRNDTDRFS